MLKNFSPSCPKITFLIVKSWQKLSKNNTFDSKKWVKNSKKIPFLIPFFKSWQEKRGKNTQKYNCIKKSSKNVNFLASKIRLDPNILKKRLRRE
jgi:hypothetical protein